MPAYDNVVIEPQFVLTSEAAIEAVVFIVTNNKGYINVICCLVSKGPLIYYVSTFFLSTTTFSRIFLSAFFLHLLKFQNAAWKIRLNVMVKKKFFGFTKTTIFVKKSAVKSGDCIIFYNRIGWVDPIQWPCIDMANWFGKFSWLPSKNKVAFSEAHKLQCVVLELLFISYFVSRRQPAELIFFSKKIRQMKAWSI